MRFIHLTLSVIGLSVVLLAASPGNAEDQQPVFEADVQPLFAMKCGKCHSAQARKGGLDLSTMDGIRRGGESGDEAVAEKLEDSLIWSMLEDGEMPPEGEGQLTDAELSLIRNWIETGAPSTQGDLSRVTQHDVLPYLYTRCVVCHGRRVQQAKLDLRTVDSIRRGGKSGPAVVPGKPELSLLLKKIHAKDMPPPKELIRAGVRPLEPNEIELITNWIAQGAVEYDIQPDAQTEEPDPLVSDQDREFWAFQTPRKVTVPNISSVESSIHSGLTPIDAFLLRKLQDRGLKFSEFADRQTLIRRVAFDLTGLPPKWDDMERFLSDRSADWYPRVVDFYLNSPHYGERWGRHWLDISGYSDSEGKRSADPVRAHAWRYRDYVVRSFNDDKPFDRFLLEQLAGDELHDFENADEPTPEMVDALIATGFLRMAPDGTGSDIVDTVDERFEVVADEIEILGSAVLGLTLRCAQCHSHKYDPIPQRDYYRLVAVFQGSYDVYDWMKPTSVKSQSQGTRERRYLDVAVKEERESSLAANMAVDAQIKVAQNQLAERRAEFREIFVDEKLATLPEAIRDDVRVMLTTAKAERTKAQLALADQYEAALTIDDKKLEKTFKELATLRKATDEQVGDLNAGRPIAPLIRALWDRGEPSPTWVFRRGQYTNPGELVGPGVPSVLTDGRTPFRPTPKRAGSTGRRLAFAEWLIDGEHPLTARVFVNRVWSQHFGRGIVESTANFGKTGTPPTHPELLDWLAVSFVENGWSIKSLHRQILNSRAYQQSSHVPKSVQQNDPDNRWLSRMPLRRLEAESVRDSLLAVAGQLNLTPFGRPDSVTARPDGLVTSDRGDAGWRRTVYVQQRRSAIPTILETFDLPQMMPNCVERPDSTVASQALHLLNNGMVRELAREFAEQVIREHPNDPYRQVELTYKTALSRLPTDDEKQLALESLEQLTAHWQRTQAAASEEATEEKVPPATLALAGLCRVIVNSAEFIFID
jgi:mono/diheme cytochrome c family protein